MLDLKRHIVGTVGEPQTSVLWRLRRMEELHTQLMDRFNEYVMAQKKEKSRLYKAATDALKIAGGAAASYLGLKHVGGP